MLIANFRRVHGMEATLNTLRGPIGEVKGQLIQPGEREGVEVIRQRDFARHCPAERIFFKYFSRQYPAEIYVWLKYFAGQCLAERYFVGHVRQRKIFC